MNEIINGMIQVLKGEVAKHPGESFYGVALHDNNLSLNTMSAYERMEKGNHVWVVDDWELAGVVTGWFQPDPDVDDKEHSLAILKAIDDHKTEIFPAIVDWFKVIYQNGDEKYIGVAKITAAFSDDMALGKLYNEHLSTESYKEALSVLQGIENLEIKIDTGAFFPSTLAELAIKAGDKPSIKYLLSKGIKVEKASAWTTDAEILQCLIDNGMELDTSVDELINAASEDKYLPFLKLLVKQGADINAQSSRGETALMRAIGNGNIKISSYLLNIGADTSLKNNDKETVFEIADYQNVKKLLEKFK